MEKLWSHAPQTGRELTEAMGGADRLEALDDADAFRGG